MIPTIVVDSDSFMSVYCLDYIIILHAFVTDFAPMPRKRSLYESASVML